MAGNFIWHELLTTDAAAATDFYTEVVGWTARDSGMPGFAYTILSNAEAMIAGLMAQPAGATPGWIGYVAVEDTDAAAAKAVSLGGRVLHPAHDIPGVGRVATISDPQGAAVALFRPAGEGARVPG